MHLKKKEDLVMKKEKQTSKTRIIHTTPDVWENEWHVQKKFLGIWWTVYSSWYKHSCLDYVAPRKSPEYYE